MVVEFLVTELSGKIACRFASLVVLVGCALLTGCRSFEPVFISEHDPAVLVEVDPRAAKADVHEPRRRGCPGIGDVYILASPHLTAPLELRLQEDGTVTVPSLGTFVARGKTIAELHSEFVRRDSRYRNSSLRLRDVQPSYAVLGEVNAPGPKPYAGVSTVSQAIQAAGGFTKSAKTRSVKLTRANGSAVTVRLGKYPPNADYEPTVFPGDSIFVERSRFIAH